MRRSMSRPSATRSPARALSTRSASLSITLNTSLNSASGWLLGYPHALETFPQSDDAVRRCQLAGARLSCGVMTSPDCSPPVEIPAALRLWRMVARQLPLDYKIDGPTSL
jgi:hypothetical protein